MMALGVRRILLSGVILMAWAGSAHAQAIGSIFGKVTDTSGAVMPGVTVTVAGTGLQQPLVAVTSETGAYQFPSVPIGTYTVTFELASFKKAVRQNVIITTGFNAGIDQKLEVGEMAEELTVSAASPVVDSEKDHHRSDLRLGHPREDPHGARRSADCQHGGGSSAERVQRRRLGIWPAADILRSRLERRRPVEPRRRHDHGPLLELVGLVLQLRRVRSDSGDNGWRRRLGAVWWCLGQPYHQEREQRVQGHVQRHVRRRQHAGEQRDRGALHAGGWWVPFRQSAVQDRGLFDRSRRPHHEGSLWYWGAWDYQDTNVGITNFFDPNKGSVCQDLIAAQNTRQLSSAITYGNLDQVQQCLKNDKTWITNLNAKVNYQLNPANKFAYLFVSDEKRRDSRGASSTTAVEATTQQYADKRHGVAYPTHQIQHTLIASDKLVFNNMFTYLGNGFFLDYQDYQECGDSRYTGATDPADYMTGARANPDCLWNQQALNNRTTGFNSRSLTNSYQTVRNTWEVKSDGTYFLTNKLGGDHSLKFGVGWRKAPIQSFSHYSGGGRARLQCVGNSVNNCGNGERVAVGASAGLVPFQAVLFRDLLVNNDWWSYNGYIQNSYSRGRWRLNGGIRYDWQQSKYLGGCVAANIIRPDLLPEQCETETQVDSANDRKIQSFGNWSPRLSVTSRPVRHRKNVGARERLVLLRHEVHTCQQPFGIE